MAIYILKINILIFESNLSDIAMFGECHFRRPSSFLIEPWRWKDHEVNQQHQKKLLKHMLNILASVAVILFVYWNASRDFTEQMRCYFFFFAFHWGSYQLLANLVIRCSLAHRGMLRRSSTPVGSQHRFCATTLLLQVCWILMLRKAGLWRG